MNMLMEQYTTHNNIHYVYMYNIIMNKKYVYKTRATYTYIK